MEPLDSEERRIVRAPALQHPLGITRATPCNRRLGDSARPAPFRQRPRRAPYTSFMPRMAPASTRVMALAATMGQAFSARPYTSHSAMPTVNTVYMPSEMPLTSRVRKVCSAWGTKLQVVEGTHRHNGKVCRACSGTGLRTVPHEQVGRKMANYLDSCLSDWRGSMGSAMSNSRRSGNGSTTMSHETA